MIRHATVTLVLNPKTNINQTIILSDNSIIAIQFESSIRGAQRPRHFKRILEEKKKHILQETLLQQQQQSHFHRKLCFDIEEAHFIFFFFEKT